MKKKIIKIASFLAESFSWPIILITVILTIYFGQTYYTSNSSFSIKSSIFNYSDFDDYAEIINEFERGSNIFLIAEGENDSLLQFANIIKPLLLSFDNWVYSITIGEDIDFLNKNSLKLLTNYEISNFGSIYHDPNLLPFINNFNNSIENVCHNADSILHDKNNELFFNKLMDKIELFINLNQSVAEGEIFENIGSQLVEAIIIGEKYKLSFDKNMMLAIIQPNFSEFDSSDELIKGINGIENISLELGKQLGLKIYLTGNMVNLRDQYISHNINWIFILLIILTTIAIILLYYKLDTLIFGLGIIMEFLWILGLSIIFIDYISFWYYLFCVLILALVVRSNLYFSSCYSGKVNFGINTIDKVERILIENIPIINANLIFGFSFLLLAILNTSMIKIFSVIMLLGVTVNTLFIILVYPSLLVFKERNLKIYKEPLFVSKINTLKNQYYSWFFNIKKIFVPSLIIVTIIFFIIDIKIFVKDKITDNNLFFIENKELEKKLVENFGISSNMSIIIVDDLLKEERIIEKLRGIDYIGLVEGISDYLPNHDVLENQYRYFSDLRRSINQREIRKQMSSYDLKMYKKEIERLESNIIDIQDIAMLNNKDLVYNRAKRLVGEIGDSIPSGILTKFINDLDDKFGQIKLTFLQQEFSKSLRSALQKLVNTEPLSLNNLPHDIVKRFANKDRDSFLIYIYFNDYLSNHADLYFNFSKELNFIKYKESSFIFIYQYLVDMLLDNQKNILITFIIFLSILLAIYYKSIKYFFITIIPILTGLIWLGGVLYLLGIEFNFIYLYALPFIIIISLNYSMPLIDIYISENNINSVLDSINIGLILTTLIYIIYFGFIWFAKYPIIDVISMIICIGIGINFIIIHLIIPLLINWKLIK